MKKEPSTGWQACGAAFVAVYGTLRAGGVNDIARLQPGIVCMGKAQLIGSLFDLGWYPGLTLNGAQSVLAEVYPMNAALEQAMDRIEGLWPEDVGEYRKRILTLPVMRIDGSQQAMTVLVYEAMPATVQHAPQIVASDWLQWFAGKGVQHPDSAFSLNTVQNQTAQNKK
ncbi:gamma-glutamylcyclotransferase [Comamonas sp. Y33R10-2]|uniref:gamma-glutamylcyclotransferase family protein n=1 Tax=Comamonas sp. Y33R10-2 TaxID=2853257 RepID=UPI001C5C9797|nr:gamma-glutamylcyclotransferase family protein [Comamonas sp. Y33R10-2]QXZ09090.1 gamma-glutamylcyclotransferase [Comamonas sp. Y33R10-2]